MIGIFGRKRKFVEDHIEGAICVSGETRYESDGSWSVVDSRNLKFSEARCTGRYRAKVHWNMEGVT